MATPVTIALSNGTPSTVTPIVPTFNKFAIGPNIGGMENLFGGTYPVSPNVNWNQPTLSDFSAFPPLGITGGRMQFTWFGLLKTASQTTLNSFYLGYIVEALQAAQQAGMKVVLDCHDYGYGPVGNGRGAGQLIGSANVTTAEFAAFWKMLVSSLHAAGVAGAVAGWGLMNEPAQTAAQWQPIAQAAINAIRQVDTTTPIVIDGADSAWCNYSVADPNFFGANGLTDPSNLLVMDGHYYIATWEGSPPSPNAPWTPVYDWPTVVAPTPPPNPTPANGGFGQSITSGVTNVGELVSSLSGSKFGGMLGEFGFACNNTGWLMMAYETIQYCQKNNLWVTPFSAGPETPQAYPFFMGRAGEVVPQMAVMQAFTGVMPTVAHGTQPVVTGTAAPNSNVYLTRLASNTYQANLATIKTDANGNWSHTLVNAGVGINIYVVSDSPMSGNSVAPLAAICFDQL